MQTFLWSIFFVQTVNAALNFMVIGDWGGDEVSPYTTPGQLATVAGMDKIVQKVGAKFMLALGDNFYHEGVKSESDTRFATTFEQVYTPTSLQFNWYVVAGNHDHEGNVSAQIAYSKDSPRWIYPSEYHAHSFTADDGATIDIILIDTVDLASIILAEKSDPAYFEALPVVEKEKASTQWTWIENQLKASTADYVLVGGHYPVYSVCQHGNTATLVNNLMPMLQTYNAHYVCGHDHCMEHIKDSAASPNYYLVGMGVECCYSNSNAAKVPKNSAQWYIASNNAPKNVIGGFASFSVSKTGMVVTYYDQDGNVLYTAPAVPPRVK